MSPNQSPFDVHQVHQVAIPVTSCPDSGSSIGSGSPTSLHDTPSPHGAPTVKFAPLPQIDPNRTRSLAPLGVPGRSRRKQVIQQEGRSLLWSTDPDVPEEEGMEDPIISFAKFVKKTSKTLWRKVRKSSKPVPQPVESEQESETYSPEPVLNIGSTDDMVPEEKGERMSKAVGLEEKRRRRASWSPLAERRTLSRGKARRSTKVSY
ncbi:hypothetical protein L210DRAFT_2808590 [Boletus edulis BED1]|uniref:Uncharacterized protein n=1 Tax=Boletus edulis BED1 TaxID=1328754 RepID=A0AAD4C352_BOLED|nr:hypothetical protein L210DRAFT_2808590 [Boletus edulis BED1]